MLGQRASRRSTQTPPRVIYTDNKSWDLGVNSRLDADRTPLKALRTAENSQLNQDGILEARPGLKLYGVQPVGIVLGQVFEYVKMNGIIPETWLLWMENRSGVGTLMTAKDGGVALVVPGKTYDITAKAHFEQVYGNVTITNGIDVFSTMDIPTQTITPRVTLTQPSGAPTVVPATVAGFNGTNVTLFYKYTFANQGETGGSTAGTATVNKLREQWNGTTENVVISGSGVPTGTQRVNIYVSYDATTQFYLDSVTITGGATTFTYTDYGNIAEQATRIAPVGDTTAGVKTTRVTNINGVPYMTGDTDNPDRIWFGSSIGGQALDFSSYNGGGYVSPNKGGKDFPVIVKAFRDGKGTPMAACFSKGTNGVGKRYLLNQATITRGTTTISYMSVQEDNGQDGTDSPDGVVMLNDGAYYPSRTGFKTSNTKANIQNIISTNGISDVIAPDVTALSSKYMDNCVGLANDQRIYYALPVQSTTNNQIWVLDLRQNGAWMRPWYVSASWMLLYADNSDGLTKFLVVSNNKIMQFDSGTATNDNGVPFSVARSSGSIKCGANGESANLRYVTFVYLRPQGQINMSVTVNTEDGPITYSDTLNETANQSVGAWGGQGWGTIGWGNLASVATGSPVTAARARVTKTIEVDEECDYYSWSDGSTAAGVSGQLAEIIDSKVMVGVKDPVN